MLIEASKGGHTGVVQLLLDYPNWMYQQQQTQEVRDIVQLCYATEIYQCSHEIGRAHV